MSGHSKWHTIKHKKGAADAKRGRVFTRIIKELTIAARAGGGDPDTNPRLRTVVADAKQVNMPADNIKRAIRRGTGEEPGVQYDEVSYEGYGPGGVAIIIETFTDNRNRTVGEIRHMLTKYGGNLGETNSVSWMFEKKGYIVIEKAKATEDTLMAAALDAGADDLRDDGDNWEVLSAPEALPGGQGSRPEARHRDRVGPGGDAAEELRLARGPRRAEHAEAARPPRGSRRRAARVVEHGRRREGARGVRVRVFGVDPGSAAHRVRLHRDRRQPSPPGRLRGDRDARPAPTFPDKLLTIHQALGRLLRQHRPDCVAVESVFYAANVRSALKLGHARGVALLAAVEGGYPLVEYAPAEIKQAVVGYGRAEKHQVGEMVRLLLGLTDDPRAARRVGRAGGRDLPRPQRGQRRGARRRRAGRRDAGEGPRRGARAPKSWREYRP